MHRVSREKQKEIRRLRRLGRSIPEISRTVGVSKTTVQRHVLGVTVPVLYRRMLKEKQGGSKQRAAAVRSNLREQAKTVMGELSERDCLLILTGLYWGEGTKQDFSLINSDPALIQTIVYCLEAAAHVPRSRISLSLRIHEGVSLDDAKKFWSRVTKVPLERLTRVEIVNGKKKGKLEYGMCRVRVSAGIRERLFVQALITLIGENSAKRL